MSLVVCDNVPVRSNQRIIMNALWETEFNPLLMLYNEQGNGTNEELNALMQTCNGSVFESVTGPLGYHISLLNLLAACCRGKATLEEVRCKSLFRFDDMVHCIVNPKTIWAVKLPMLMLLYDAYLDLICTEKV